MHVCELVDLAAVVSLHGRMLIAENVRLADESLCSYWSASRCRLDRWGRTLKSIEGPIDQSPSQVQNDHLVLVEEIVASEILSRVVTALLVAYDSQHQLHEAGPIARNILYGHIDARRRALRIVPASDEDSLDNEDLVDHLFRRAQQWNDLLIGQMLTATAVEEFSFDPGRAHEFACDARQLLRSSAAKTSAALMRCSLRSSFAPLACEEGFSADLNAQIAAAVIGCFGPEFFDSHGLLKTTWQHRMETTAADAAAMVGELLDWVNPPRQLPAPRRWQR